MAVYGVRGVGSIYYLSYAGAHMELVNEGKLWAIIAFTILVRNADAPMYQAKSRGGGRYVVFQPAMQERIAARLSLEGDLRRAVLAGTVETAVNVVHVFTGIVDGEPAVDRRELVEARFFARHELPRPLGHKAAKRIEMLDRYSGPGA